MACYGQFHSVMSYGAKIWGMSPAERIIQKKVMKLICDIGGRESCRILFQGLDVLTLPSLIIMFV